jgi:hypothetical protein
VEQADETAEKDVTATATQIIADRSDESTEISATVTSPLTRVTVTHKNAGKMKI